MTTPDDDTTVSPHIRRAVGPQMAGFVGQTPLDQEAADQIQAILENPEVEALYTPMVAVALLNCLERRITEAEDEIKAYRALATQIEKATKS